jgi:hypothetical protein
MKELREKWAKLTDNEKRVAIAKLSGWEEHIDDTDPECICSWFSNKYVIAVGIGHLPFFNTSLDAMFDAEETLLDEKYKARYSRMLWMVLGWTKSQDLTRWEYAHISAEKRAEAFYLTFQ